jgi:hypothetical protein
LFSAYSFGIGGEGYSFRWGIENMATRRPAFVYWRYAMLAFFFLSGLINGAVSAPLMYEKYPLAWVLASCGLNVLLSPFIGMLIVGMGVVMNTLIGPMDKDRSMFSAWCLLLRRDLLNWTSPRLSRERSSIDKKWERPTFTSNPFRPGNPLIFAHFLGHLTIASGAANLVCTPWIGVPALLLGVSGILSGFGILLGLRWCIRLAGNKVLPRISHNP